MANSNQGSVYSGSGDPNLRVSAPGGSSYLDVDNGDVWTRPSSAQPGSSDWSLKDSGGSGGLPAATAGQVEEGTDNAVAATPLSLQDARTAQVAGANVIYVSKEAAATDDRTGLSKYDYVKPFATIQAAIDAAVSGDVIQVSSGVFSRFVCKDGVDLICSPGTIVEGPTRFESLDDVQAPLTVPDGVSANLYGPWQVRETPTEIPHDDFICPVVRLIGTGDTVFEFASVRAESNNIGGIYIGEGKVATVRGDLAYSELYDAIWVNSATVTLDVVTAWANTAGASGLEMGNGTVRGTIENCSSFELYAGVELNLDLRVSNWFKPPDVEIEAGRPACASFTAEANTAVCNINLDIAKMDPSRDIDIFGASGGEVNIAVKGAFATHAINIDSVDVAMTLSGVIWNVDPEAATPVNVTSGTCSIKSVGLVLDNPINVPIQGAYILDGVVMEGTLPTSASGLPVGALWNDSGTLKIVQP